jgi:predicted nucleic acid-binding Zn ribbon protein
MIDFYSGIVPFVIDTLIYATIFIIALGIVVKNSDKLSFAENRKRKRNFRLLFVFVAAPVLTGFLYSTFGVNLGMIFSAFGSYVIGGFLALILIFVFFSVFKSFFKSFSWLGFFLPVIAILFAVLFLKDNIRDYVIYFSVFFFFLFVLFKMSFIKNEDAEGDSINKEIKSVTKKLKNPRIRAEEKTRLSSRLDSLKNDKIKNKRMKEYLSQIRNIEREVVLCSGLLEKYIKTNCFDKYKNRLIGSLQSLKTKLDNIKLNLERERFTGYNDIITGILEKIVNLMDTISGCGNIMSVINNKVSSINTLSSQIIDDCDVVIKLLNESNNLTWEINEEAIKKDRDIFSKIDRIKEKDLGTILDDLGWFENDILYSSPVKEKVDDLELKDNNIVEKILDLQKKLKGIQGNFDYVKQFISESPISSDVLKNVFLGNFSSANAKILSHSKNLGKTEKHSEKFNILYREKLINVFKLLKNDMKNFFRR